MVKKILGVRRLLDLLTVALAFIFGVFAFIQIEYGKISSLQLVSVLRSSLSADEVRLDLIASFSFIVSLSIFLGVSLSQLGSKLLSLHYSSLTKNRKTLPRYPTFQIAAVIGPNVIAVLLIAISTVSLSPSLDTKSENGPRLLGSQQYSHSNVVHVFIESLPTRLDANSSILDIDDIFLNSSDGWIVSPGVKSVGGHENTILGLISAWCSSPYPSIEFHDPGSDSFGMKGTTCIHDYYSELDYKLEFVGGYNAGFQSKDIYLQQKGVEILDKTFWESIESQGFDSWNSGLNDRKLFTNLSSVVDSNLIANRKFYLTALTLDTHDAHVTPNHCPGKPLSGAEIIFTYSCVGEIVKEFSDWLSYRARASGPILLVIQGDHLPGFAPNQKSENGVFFAAACLGGSDPSSFGLFPESFLGIASYVVEASRICGSTN